MSTQAIGCAVAQRLTAALTGLGIPYEKLAEVVYGELRTIAQEQRPGDWIEAPGGVTYSKDGLAPSTRLYFEAHVTLDPVFGIDRENVSAIAKRHGFKLADLIMRKAAHGLSVPHAEDTFTTARAVDFDDIRVRTMAVVRDLRAHGYSVRRYKVENTLVDSKAKGGMGGDLWELLR